MIWLKMAFLNLFRYKRRTFITASALAYGVLMFIFIDSFMSGTNAETYRNYRELETGDAQILAAGWWENKEEVSLEYLIQNPLEIEEFLTDTVHTPHVDFPAEMLFYQSEGFVEDGNLPIKVRAIDPERAPQVFKQFTSFDSGRMFEPQDSKVILGSWFADKLGAKEGASILLEVKTQYGMVDIIELTVGGIIHTSDLATNRSAVYVPLLLVDEILELEGGITGFTLLASDDKIEGLRKGIGPAARLLDFEELTLEFRSLAQLSDAIVYVIVFFIFLIAAVGVTNTMMIGVFERKHEVGMMRSLGMPDRGILYTFIIEAIGIGILGLAIGFVIALPLNWWLVNYGIDYSFMFEEFQAGYRTSGILRGVWKPESYLNCALTGMIVSGIMAIIPSQRMLKKPIPDNLRILA